MRYVEARDLARTTTGLFQRTFDADPERWGRAPGRVNLIGEHTDYNGGLCLPIALPHATWAAVTSRRDDTLRVVSDLAEPWAGRRDDATGWAAYVAGILAELDVPGADVAVVSDVPLGAGLSSSAALICAVAAALGSSDVDAAIRAETVGVGAPTGGLDQTVVVLAQPGEALLLDFATGSRQPVAWRPEDAGLALLVTDTRVQHSHESGGYGDRRRECEEAAARLGVHRLADLTEVPADERRARHVVTEIRRVRRVVEAVGSGDWDEVGRCFTDSHASLRDDFEVSCPELDLAVAAALDAGVLGARMTGGGFGGSTIALVPADRVDTVAEAIAARFAEGGHAEPRFLLSPASAGAGAVDQAR